jgi:poly-gamma-glutamate capsule biosynthesis protein CapA/YwtB (metallophosphatase superfamily)
MFATDMIRNRPFFSRCCQRAVFALGAVLFSSLQVVSQANGQDGITVTAVGDVRITDRMIRIQLNELHKIRLRGDLVFANFEGVISEHPSSDQWKFAAAPESGAILSAMGINFLGMANNHVLDLGEEAYRATTEKLRREGFLVSGIDENETVARIRSHEVRVIAYSFTSPRNNVTDSNSVPTSFGKKADEILIISAHMGGEDHTSHTVPGAMEYFGPEQRGDVMAFSHRCIDAGADLVLGHGPHVPRGIELYKGKLIVYSLGNFAFDYPGVSTRGNAPGYSISVRLDGNGDFRWARIDSYELRSGLPVKDRSANAYWLVRDLTLGNLKQTAFSFLGDGRVVLKGRE